jgi:ribosomal protein S27E
VHANDQRHIPRDQRATFTPLCGKWLKCNWNGKVVSRKTADSARRSRLSDIGFRRIISASPDRPKELTQKPHPTSYQAERNTDGYIRCPNCENYQYVGKHAQDTCLTCNIRFDITNPLSAKAYNSDGNVFCPICSATVLAGAVFTARKAVCRRGHSFTAKPYYN